MFFCEFCCILRRVFFAEHDSCLVFWAGLFWRKWTYININKMHTFEFPKPAIIIIYWQQRRKNKLTPQFTFATKSLARCFQFPWINPANLLKIMRFQSFIPNTLKSWIHKRNGVRKSSVIICHNARFLKIFKRLTATSWEASYAYKQKRKIMLHQEMYLES